MKKMQKLPIKAYQTLVQLALEEDIGTGDITSLAVNQPNERFVGYLTARESGVLVGNDIAKFVLKKISPRAKYTILIRDGQPLKRGSKIARIEGTTKEVLMAERVILNFMQRLSGIASTTYMYVKQVKNTSSKILDTRKTTPGWRLLEKYAVVCGGGYNHRLGLYDMILIKDNHISSLAKHCKQAIAEAISRARKKYKFSKKIIVEVDTLGQLQEALSQKPDIVLLDNMSLAQLRKAVAIRNQMKSKALLEASGGVNLKTVHAIAKTGVERISIGSLTHSVRALDIGLDS